MVHRGRCRGHSVWTSVSTTCSLHLTLPRLVDACTIWLRKGVALSTRVGLFVDGGTYQSFGTQFWMSVLRNRKVICNSHSMVFYACTEPFY